MPGILYTISICSKLKSCGLAIIGFAFSFRGTISISIISSVFSNKLIYYIRSVMYVTMNTTASIESITTLLL